MVNPAEVSTHDPVICIATEAERTAVYEMLISFRKITFNIIYNHKLSSRDSSGI